MTQVQVSHTIENGRINNNHVIGPTSEITTSNGSQPAGSGTSGTWDPNDATKWFGLSETNNVLQHLNTLNNATTDNQTSLLTITQLDTDSTTVSWNIWKANGNNGISEPYQVPTAWYWEPYAQSQVFNAEK
ncbi:MAG: hypothetical protein LBE12_15015, partial [Planctomycetaceae bacterium]|nr:hypothetical protein [Planctomycetaceae bacterium]